MPGTLSFMNDKARAPFVRHTDGSTIARWATPLATQALMKASSWSGRYEICSCSIWAPAFTLSKARSAR
ncbi:unannotated protein [freshwater metagenome]|uniref:Unannotated protein n=1 Tax=freshwater metagenome TaxID=449393 RepID=A0A6J7PF48_9ZZZZ